MLLLGILGGGPSSLSLADLSDVSIVGPASAQYLRYNGALTEWQNSYIGADIFSYLDTNLLAAQGVVITPIPGPNTITIGLGAITPTSVAATGTVTGTNISGSNTGDQTLNSLLPSQSGNNGKVLSTDGTDAFWVTVGSGTGTVTSVALSGNSGISVSGSPITTSGTITLSLDNITPTSVSASGTISASNFSGNSSGTNTGDQTITLTGDVTGSGTGSFATTLATTGVTANTYGSSTQVPVFTVDAKGRISSVTNTTIAVSSMAIVLVSGTTQSALSNTQYVLTNTAAATTITFPSSPTDGDTIWITNTTSRTDHVVDRNGQNIMGLAQNMTIDKANVNVQFRFISTIG